MSLPDESRLPFQHPLATTSLRRLSRSSLISIAITWLDPSDLRRCGPVLDPDAAPSSNPGLSSGSLASLDQIRSRFLAADELKDTKKEVLEAIDVHWSAGLTLRQWVMVDEMRIASESSGEAGQAGGMQWGGLRLDRLNVDYGMLERYVDSVEGFKNGNKNQVLRTKAAVFARELQAELAPLIRTHVAVLKLNAAADRSESAGKGEEPDVQVLRVVCFGDGTVLSKEGILSNCDDAKVLFIAFKDVGNTLHVSPANTSTDGNGPLSLVLRSLERKLSSGLEGRAELKPRSTAHPVSCRDLFKHTSTRGQGQAQEEYAPDTQSLNTKTNQLATAKPKAKLDKAAVEKRMKIKELRNKVRFQGGDESEDDGEEE